MARPSPLGEGWRVILESSAVSSSSLSSVHRYVLGVPLQAAVSHLFHLRSSSSGPKDTGSYGAAQSSGVEAGG